MLNLINLIRAGEHRTGLRGAGQVCNQPDFSYNNKGQMSSVSSFPSSGRIDMQAFAAHGSGGEIRQQFYA
jgi:hypothetical protein